MWSEMVWFPISYPNVYTGGRLGEPTVTNKTVHVHTGNNSHRQLLEDLHALTGTVVAGSSHMTIDKYHVGGRHNTCTSSGQASIMRPGCPLTATVENSMYVAHGGTTDDDVPLLHQHTVALYTQNTGTEILC